MAENNTADMVWLVLRARLGREYAVNIDAIASICDCTIGEAKGCIKAMRDAGVRIAYSNTKPQGYFIPTPDDDMGKDDTVSASIAAVVSLIVRAMLTRRTSLGVMMYEIEGLVSARLTGALEPLKKALPPPASQKQITKLSEFVLSSLLDPDERDMVYQLMASLDLNKDTASDTISDLKARIEKREENRVASKRERMVFNALHNPGKPISSLIDRDKSRVQQTWNKAQDTPEEGEGE